MPRLNALVNPPAPEFPVLTRLLWQALALGLLAVVAVPAARGEATLFGSLPFWLLAAPAAALLALYRRFLATAWRAHLVRATPRRRQVWGQITFPQAIPRKSATPRGKCALTPVPATSAKPVNPAHPTAFSQAA